MGPSSPAKAQLYCSYLRPNYPLWGLNGSQCLSLGFVWARPVSPSVNVTLPRHLCSEWFMRCLVRSELRRVILSANQRSRHMLTPARHFLPTVRQALFPRQRLGPRACRVHVPDCRWAARYRRHIPSRDYFQCRGFTRQTTTTSTFQRALYKTALRFQDHVAVPAVLNRIRLGIRLWASCRVQWGPRWELSSCLGFPFTGSQRIVVDIDIGGRSQIGAWIFACFYGSPWSASPPLH